MHVSFGMAEYLKGTCVLRFDDTNPEAEKQEYIDHIMEIVSWLGWEPFKVLHTGLSYVLQTNIEQIVLDVAWGLAK